MKNLFTHTASETLSVPSSLDDYAMVQQLREQLQVAWLKVYLSKAVNKGEQINLIRIIEIVKTFKTNQCVFIVNKNNNCRTLAGRVCAVQGAMRK